MGGHKRTEDEIRKIHDDYINNKLSLDKVAKTYHTDFKTLKGYFVKYNLHIKTKKESDKEKQEKLLAVKGRSKSEIEAIYKDYMSGTNLVKLSLKYHLHIETIKRNFLRYDLVLKDTEQMYKEKMDKLERTNLERHGTKYVMGNEEIKNRLKESLKKYDRKKANSIRENTCINTYGEANISKVEDIKNKKVETCQNNYKTNYGFLKEGIKEQLKKERFEKRLKVLLPILKERNYELLDTYDGNALKIEGKHLHYKQYKIKHTVCNNVFFDDLFELPRCKICYPDNASVMQLYFKSYIESLGFKVESMSKQIVNPKNNYKWELDILIPELKIAFEYNGTYYHSATKKDCNYHLDKSAAALKQGIKLFHIWEHDNVEIVKSKINIILGRVQYKESARKLAVKFVTPDIEKLFLKGTHLHGYTRSLFSLGLFKNNELEALISFRKIEGCNDLELARFSVKLNTVIIGGFSRLFAHAMEYIKQAYPQTTSIVSYCYRDWTPDFANSVYSKSGFNFIGASKPSLYYVSNKKVYSRLVFQKYKLKEKFPDVYDENLTANDILTMKGIYPIYNSGNWKFEFKIKKVQGN